MKNKKLVLDLDNTLCSQEHSDTYAFAAPRKEVILSVNQFHRQGGFVVIHTARGMETFGGDVPLIEKRYRVMTENWLQNAGVEYDQLIFGKPSGDYYVDDKGMSIEDFVDIYRPKVVFTNGCFDVLHAGHVTLLQECRKMAGAGRVIVGLNSDESVRKLKGEGRPINNVEFRKTVLSALRFVDEVVVFEEDTPLELIKKIRPDIIVKGGDYTSYSVVGKEFAGKVRIIPLFGGLSSSKVIEKEEK